MNKCNTINQPILNQLETLNEDATERVQQRFTKRLRGFGNYTYSERLHLLKLPSLELRRLRIDLIWCYKIIFGLVNLSPSDFF